MQPKYQVFMSHQTSLEEISDVWCDVRVSNLAKCNRAHEDIFWLLRHVEQQEAEIETRKADADGLFDARQAALREGLATQAAKEKAEIFEAEAKACRSAYNEAKHSLDDIRRLLGPTRSINVVEAVKQLIHGELADSRKRGDNIAANLAEAQQEVLGYQKQLNASLEALSKERQRYLKLVNEIEKERNDVREALGLSHQFGSTVIVDTARNAAVAHENLKRMLHELRTVLSVDSKADIVETAKALKQKVTDNLHELTDIRFVLKCSTETHLGYRARQVMMQLASKEQAVIACEEKLRAVKNLEPDLDSEIKVEEARKILGAKEDESLRAAAKRVLEELTATHAVLADNERLRAGMLDQRINAMKELMCAMGLAYGKGGWTFAEVIERAVERLTPPKPPATLSVESRLYEERLLSLERSNNKIVTTVSKLFVWLGKQSTLDAESFERVINDVNSEPEGP